MTRRRVAELEEEVASLRRINDVLMDRAERRMRTQGDAFAVFQLASNLEKTVDDRTLELRRVNERLEHELDLRRSFETALLRAKEQAEEATASRTRFVASASHDLRQPLNAALLYLETIDRSGLKSEDAEAVAGVARALETLNSLLSALLDISRLDSGGLHPEPRHFSVGSLFQRLGFEYASIASLKGLSLRVVSTDAVVNSDSMLLENVLRNLLSNAIKYTPRGRVLMGVRRRGDRLRFEIHDTGIGIAPEHQQQIFEEFWRAPDDNRDERGSMGLGLSIVERICRLLGAQIELRSTPGRGSVFRFELPCGDAAEKTPAPVVSGVLPGHDLGRLLVVVVDDNQQVLRSMERLLQSWGSQVIAGRGVEEVLTVLIDNDMTPDLLLTDYHLGDACNGLDAIDMIRKEVPGNPQAVMISSDSSSALRDRLDALGIPLLTKPLEPARLRAVMLHLTRENSRANVDRTGLPAGDC